MPASDRGNAVAVVRAAFDYTSKVIRSVDLKGTTDAITTLRLGEASCGGKSRLFAALCRAGGIPARLVGGLILKDGTWRSSHIWAEAWIAGRWVPFCPLNGYFAEIPSHYLILYYGDQPLLTHSVDINFNYYFHGKKVLAPPSEAMQAAKKFPAGTLSLWWAFEQVRIPLNLLKIILMIPFGALVVVLARNVIGIETFGTFMPALMAVAFRDTGLAWGLMLFLAILLFGGIIRCASAVVSVIAYTEAWNPHDGYCHVHNGCYPLRCCDGPGLAHKGEHFSADDTDSDRGAFSHHLGGRGFGKSYQGCCWNCDSDRRGICGNELAIASDYCGYFSGDTAAGCGCIRDCRQVDRHEIW